MRKEETTLAIAKKVNERLKKSGRFDDKPPLSDEDVFNIIDFQFVAVSHAMSKQQSIRLSAFGSFQVSAKRVNKINERFEELGINKRFKNVESIL
jgi:nucleoid DNA-binding protein